MQTVLSVKACLHRVRGRALTTTVNALKQLAEFSICVWCILPTYAHIAMHMQTTSVLGPLYCQSANQYGSGAIW